MSQAEDLSEQRDASSEALRVGLVLFAVYHLGLAAFMAIAPHAFYKDIGPFEALNRHYIRDTATFTAALGVGFVVALRLPSWRVPVLGVTTVQFALHSLNHLVDAHKAHPEWTGWFDFGSLLASTLLLAWMLRTAMRMADPSIAPATAGPSPLAPTPLPERSPS
ncbi:MAG TPA: hypothetical protein VH061_08970 [Solirubrobacteraceae bacterium]|jgi:hypothetical protein|nr:hypothetical protein [Solirubrobacteraceae bacterium]